MAIHQCSRFFNIPHLVHKCAIRRNEKYLASTCTYVDVPDRNQQLTTCSVVYGIDVEKGIKCYVDACFAGGWYQADADNV